VVRPRPRARCESPPNQAPKKYAAGAWSALPSFFQQASVQVNPILRVWRDAAAPIVQTFSDLSPWRVRRRAGGRRWLGSSRLAQ
jgi:hypothetical protein